MSAIILQHEELRSYFKVLVAEDLDFTPPELFIMDAAVCSLPNLDTEGYFAFSQEDFSEFWDTDSNTRMNYLSIASWDGHTENSLGYGEITLFFTPVGYGLEINYAGTEGSSAATIYVIPAWSGWQFPSEER